MQEMQHSVTGDERPRGDSFLLCCGIIGAIVFGVVNFAFSAVNPDYVVVRQPIGDLALRQYGWIQSVDFIVFGLFTWAFAIGLRRELRNGFGATIIPLSHELIAVGAIFAGVFASGVVHVVSSIIIFLAMTASQFLFAYRFKGDERWKGWTTYSVITGVLMTFFLILFAWATVNHGYAGLMERMANVARGFWLTFFAIKAVVGGSRLT